MITSTSHAPLTKTTHETGGEGGVGAHLAIDLHQTLHADHLHFVIRQSVLQTVADDQQQRQALSLLVGTAARLRSPHTAHLVQHPVLRGVQTLHMLLRTTSLPHRENTAPNHTTHPEQCSGLLCKHLHNTYHIGVLIRIRIGENKEQAFPESTPWIAALCSRRLPSILHTPYNSALFPPFLLSQATFLRDFFTHDSVLSYLQPDGADAVRQVFHISEREGTSHAGRGSDALVYGETGGRSSNAP